MEQRARMREEEGATLVKVKGGVLKRKSAAKLLGAVLEGKRKRCAPSRMGVYVPLTSIIIDTDVRSERTPELPVGKAAVAPALQSTVPGAHLPCARRKQRCRAAARPKTGERQPARLAAATDEAICHAPQYS